jgi:hypothetical protein
MRSGTAIKSLWKLHPIILKPFLLLLQAYVIVSATFGHLQDSSLELSALKPCPVWITPY